MIERNTTFRNYAAMLPILAALLAFQPQPVGAEEFRDFTNHSGQAMKATIVSATETDVTLKRENGTQITGGITFFSAADQAYIAEWREANPVELKYDFNIEATRQRTGRTKQTEGNLIVVYETWKFAIKVENRTKAGTSGSDLEGVQLVYNLSKSAKSRARLSRSLHEGLVPSGGLLVKADTVDLGTLQYLKPRQTETDIIPINHSELAPGWYYTDGTKDQHNDVLEGIKVQIVKDGKVLGEKTFGSKAATDAKWVEPRAAGSGSR